MLSPQPKTLTIFIKCHYCPVSLSELGCSGVSALTAACPAVGLQTHTLGNSGQVQEKALIIGWQVCGVLRWGWAVTLEEDTQNELPHQKLRLATSMHVWAIFQMSISGAPEETMVLLLS